MSHTVTSQFSINGKALSLFCASLHDEEIPAWVGAYAEEAFKNLIPHLKNPNQVLYVRDLDFLTIDGKYPGGHCYNEFEAMVAVTNWQPDKQQVKATFNHELHHMARWQNAGYGDTLGGAILSEGLATFYEELRSDWSPPWSQTDISKQALEAAIKEWDSKQYDHADWFFDGSHGRWVGYSIGYRLAKLLFTDGFDLAKSVNTTPEDVKDLVAKINTD